jgi:hypothetical protein
MAVSSFVTVITPPTNRDLTTLANAREELNLTSHTSDRKIRRWITECSNQIVTYLDRQLAMQTVMETFRQWWQPGMIWNFYNVPSPVDPQAYLGGAGRPLRVSIRPVASISSVTVDGTTLASEFYTFDANSGFVWQLADDGSGQHVPWNGFNIQITYTGGFQLPSDPDLPSNISRVCLMLVRHRWWGDDKDPMIRQENVPGILETIYVTSPPGDDASMPPEACGLLQPYRRIEVP